MTSTVRCAIRAGACGMLTYVAQTLYLIIICARASSLRGRIIKTLYHIIMSPKRGVQALRSKVMINSHIAEQYPATRNRN